MFTTLAGMYMAAKVHFTQIKTDMTRKSDQQVAETIYINKVNKIDEKEKYQKSRMPKSGYMTVAEYEAESRGKTKREISAKILKEAEMPKDKNMAYVPQYKFKLVKYNDPVGSPELSLPRKLNFDRQINAQGIVSGDYTKLVYPSVYYYAEEDCTSCDLFLINLDTTLTPLKRVEKANVVNKETTPLISTDKSIDNKFVFRTLTPIDYSSDNSKIVVKEKIGYRHDGIWKTELWVYDFNKKQAKKLPQIREAIVHYWFNKEGVDLSEKRWDIYPLGFDANDENRIIVSAYAYTGDIPKFLGSWSIDLEGTESKLETLANCDLPVSVVGYRLEKEQEVIPISEIEFEAKQLKANEKLKKKQTKAEEKENKNLQKIEYKRKMHQMDMETLLKVKERKDQIKEAKKHSKSNDGYTGD